MLMGNFLGGREHSTHSTMSISHELNLTQSWTIHPTSLGSRHSKCVPFPLPQTDPCVAPDLMLDSAIETHLRAIPRRDPPAGHLRTYR